jgi:hypothetical protein
VSESPPGDTAATESEEVVAEVVSQEQQSLPPQQRERALSEANYRCAACGRKATDGPFQATLAGDGRAVPAETPSCGSDDFVAESEEFPAGSDGDPDAADRSGGPSSGERPDR